MDLRTAQGFLGTGASMLADITLIAYILLILPAMVAGYIFARRRMFEPQHKITMTGIVIFNWVLILWLMVFSYRDGVAPGVPAALGDVRVWLPTVHLGIGAVAQILATYLALRMWFERVLPPALMVKNIKIYMRFALAGWFIAAFLGIAIYATWYVVPTIASGGGEIPAPAATDEAVPNPESTEEVVVPPDATEEAVAEPEATEEAVAEPEATEEAVAEPEATEEAVAEPETTEEAIAEPEATEEAITAPETTEEP